MRQCTLTVLSALVAIAFAGSALATEATANPSVNEATPETTAVHGNEISAPAAAAPAVKEKIASHKIDKLAKGKKKKKRKKRRSHIKAH